jgi:hypothetical protein
MPALTGFRKDEAKNRTQVRKDQGSPGGSPYRHAKCRKMGVWVITKIVFFEEAKNTILQKS